MSKLRTGSKHVWVERNARARGPFHITTIDGDHVTVVRQPSGRVDVLDTGGDDHFIVRATNSLLLRTPGAVLASATPGGWQLEVMGRDLAAAGTPSGVSVRDGRAEFRDFPALAEFAAEKLNVTAWARDPFGGWVPADDWRAVTAGLPCAQSMRRCDRVAVKGGVCAMHAAADARVASNDAARLARVEERRGELRRRSETRRACEEALARLRPLLAELGIHPDTLTVGTADDRIGILMPAEVAERLTGAAVEGELLLSDADRSA